MQTADTQDYAQIFLQDCPLLDVRAPVEFAQGSFPGSVNLPILNDEQRVQIGTTYKQQGVEAAIALGHQLATDEVRSARIARWSSFVQSNPSGFLFCLRGGMRSKLTQEWLADQGVMYPRVLGGYKAMRAYLNEVTESLCQSLDFWVISGRTGSGKTHLLPRLNASIDLEELALHRGSSFGKRVQKQPAQATFEHALGIALLRMQACGHTALALEDESRLIGRRSIPDALFKQMRMAPVVILEASRDCRVEQIVSDYVDVSAPEYIQAFGDQQGWSLFSAHLYESLDNIRRRLGDEQHQRVKETLTASLKAYREAGDRDGFREVIGALLDHYYDRMYDYQLEKKAHRVRFRGEAEAVEEWLGKHWEAVSPHRQ